MKLKILTGSDNKILRTKSAEIARKEIIGKKLANIMRDMRETLKADDLGLAAPQVGFNLRVALVRLNNGTPHARVIVMINPEIVSAGRETEIAEEGCLSLPDVWVKIERVKNLTVKFFDERGKEQVLALEDLNARIIQHEIDHLDGILIVDKAVGDGNTTVPIPCIK